MIAVPWLRLTPIISIVLGIILIWSSLQHLSNPWAFLVAVSRYNLLSTQLTVYAAMVLPSLQFSLGIMLCSNAFLRTAASLTLVLMVVYAVAQVNALFQGLSISCGCFGSSDEELTVLTVARTIAFACAAAFVLTFPNDQERDHVTVSSFESI